MEITIQVVEKLVPLIYKEVKLHLNSDKEAKTLADNLAKIQLLLNDAERKQLSKRSVNNWLKETQDLVYDIEDALEDWEAKNHDQQQQHASRFSPTKTRNEKVWHFLLYPCSCFNKAVEHRTVALDIKGLNESVERMYSKGLSELQLMQILTKGIGPEKTESEGSSHEWRITTSDFVKSGVHGRQKDVENVKKMLLCGDGPDNKEVICVLGTGGLGKTTLAKMIYADKEVDGAFPVKVWVCVSDPFNKFQIAKEIYEGLMGGASPNFSNLDVLHGEIKKVLRDKSLHKDSKFLLVLDDVWTEDSEEWNQLYACLCEGGAKGSKILVTTRKDKTADALYVSISNRYPLKAMSDEECWSIIREKSLFLGRYEVDGLQFEGVGREIAKKCDGSPLAASFLGGHLQAKTSLKEWYEVLNSEVWKMEGVEEKLFRHFFLSYNELRPAVKRCFAYCAVFPKDYEINIYDLIRFWMAQGFLSSSKATSNDRVDEIAANGYSFFKDLAQRSFFQDLERAQKGARLDSCKRPDSCKMHDIVHDFARYLSTNSRHLWWDDMLTQQSGSISDADKLRSLFCTGLLQLEDIFRRLKSVRILSLNECWLKEIPKEIGNLIHLRYLELRSNLIKELPETIYNLCNLQTLVLRLYSLSKLPRGISNLRNLRYLMCSELEYPSEIAGLTNLRVLYRLLVKEGYNDLRYLKDLNQLEGSLNIILSETNDVEAAKTAALWKKTSLDSLLLNYCESVSTQVVEELRPHPQLQSLVVEMEFLRLPSWIVGLENLKNLSICLSGRWIEASINNYLLPPLWRLSFLEFLHIEGDCLVEEWMGNGFYGLIRNINVDDHNQKPLVAFPALKKLELGFDRNWKEWKDMSEEEEFAIAQNNIIIMPLLNELEILYCYRLETLPQHTLKKLPSLHTLRIGDCPELKKKYGDGFWISKFDVIFDD